MSRRLASLALAVALAGCMAAPAAAEPQGTDYHANCTGAFASGSAVFDDAPGAVAPIARPPKQFGALSDVGYYSRTNCA
jgi:hypothetical protein